jgi:hypothetical protein
MSRPRYLADHDLHERIIDGVLRREPAIEFIRARDRGWQILPDADLLASAAGEQWIVVSHDTNTMFPAAAERVKQGLPMTGLLLARQFISIGRIIDELVLIWAASEAEEYVDQIRYLPL